MQSDINLQVKQIVELDAKQFNKIMVKLQAKQKKEIIKFQNQLVSIMEAV